MNDQFFARPILNSPCECPARHWDLDARDPFARKLNGQLRLMGLQQGGSSLACGRSPNQQSNPCARWPENINRRR